MIGVDGIASLGSDDRIVDHLVINMQVYPNWGNHGSSQHYWHFYAREHMVWVKCPSCRPSRIHLLLKLNLEIKTEMLTGIHRGENMDSSRFNSVDHFSITGFIF